MSGKGFVRSDSPEIYVVNTCAVTAEATREASRQIRRLKKQNPLAKIVVTGCGAQVDTNKFEELKEADLVIANSHKGKLEEIVRNFLGGQNLEKTFKSNIFKKLDLEEGGGVESSHTRSFLKIQDGCNSFCTYCVIPFARGKSRSISIQEIVARVNEINHSGVEEVVLTGIHIGDYEDKNKILEDLVESVLVETKIKRIRLTSLEPIELTDRLLELYQDKRMCRHFHMSIQSAEDTVLKNMKRKYGFEHVKKSLEQIEQKVSGSFVGMDVIVGFPGETDEQFEITYSRLENLPWTKIHVFPYSDRPGTFADKIAEKVRPLNIQSRSQKLRALSFERYAMQALKQVGSEKSVLILKENKGPLIGLSRDYWRVQLSEQLRDHTGELNVKIVGYDHSNHSQMEGVLIGM